MTCTGAGVSAQGNDLRAPGQAAQSQGARSCPAADSEPLGERAANCVVVEVGSKSLLGLLERERTGVRDTIFALSPKAAPFIGTPVTTPGGASV